MAVAVLYDVHGNLAALDAVLCVVNSGSVGTPYEDEPGAYWTLDLVHRRTPYPGATLTASREDAVAEFTARGL